MLITYAFPSLFFFFLCGVISYLIRLFPTHTQQGELSQSYLRTSVSFHGSLNWIRGRRRSACMRVIERGHIRSLFVFLCKDVPRQSCEEIIRSSFALSFHALLSRDRRSVGGFDTSWKEKEQK